MADDDRDADVVQFPGRRASEAPLDETEKKFNKSPLYRMRRVFIVLGITIVVGPFIQPWFNSFRGVVLETKDDEMLVGSPLTPPRWVDGIGALPGQIVLKDRFEWDARVIEAEPKDAVLRTMYERYSAAYDGTVVELRAPMSPQGPATAVVDRDGGAGKVVVPLWGAHLAGVHVGSRIHKDPGTWDPVLLPEAP